MTCARCSVQQDPTPDPAMAEAKKPGDSEEEIPLFMTALPSKKVFDGNRCVRR